MKIKNYGLAFGVILVFAVLVLCILSQTKESALQAEKENLIKLIPKEWINKNPKSMDSLAGQIIEDNQKLAEFFKKGNFEEMAKFYSERSGVIVSEKYNVVSCIEKFWRDAWEQGAELKFKTVKIYLDDRLGKQTSWIIKDGKRQQATFDAVAFVFNEFSIVPIKAGDPVGRDMRVQCHLDSCPWGQCPPQ